MVAQARAGDQRALEELAARYRPVLLRVAYSRFGCASAADDAVQETLICLFKWLHTYDSRYSFRTWLWTILLNQCGRIARKQARMPATGWLEKQDDEQAGRLSVVHSQAPMEILLTQERNAQLARLLSRLPEAQADALRLRFFGEMKFEEIAQALDCTLSTAKYRVRAGLAQLSRWLSETGKEEGLDPSEKSLFVPPRSES